MNSYNDTFVIYAFVEWTYLVLSHCVPSFLLSRQLRFPHEVRRFEYNSSCWFVNVRFWYRCDWRSSVGFGERAALSTIIWPGFAYTESATHDRIIPRAKNSAQKRVATTGFPCHRCIRVCTKARIHIPNSYQRQWYFKEDNMRQQQRQYQQIRQTPTKKKTRHLIFDLLINILKRRALILKAFSLLLLMLSILYSYYDYYCDCVHRVSLCSTVFSLCSYGSASQQWIRSFVFFYIAFGNVRSACMAESE